MKEWHAGKDADALALDGLEQPIARNQDRGGIGE